MSEREKYIIVIEDRLIEVTREVYETYYKSRRKERYFIQELKAGRIRIDKETGEEYYLPSLEDSYDRLLSVDKQFADSAGNVEEEVIQKLLLDKLHIALEELSDEEAEIIWQLYYEEIGETEIARRLGIPRSTLQYSDVDYINRTLKVKRQLGYKMGVKKEDVPPKMFSKQEAQLKTPSSYRVLPIPDYVFEAILEQQKIYEGNRSRRKSQFVHADYICCSNYGKLRNKDFHWEYYKQLLKENNLLNIRWHDLRSTFCTLLLKNNFNPKAVSKLMGLLRN